MIPSANEMVLRIYEMLLIHHDAVFATLNANTALVQAVAEREPELWKAYNTKHLANIAASVKKQNELRGLIEEVILRLKEQLT